MTWGIWGKNLNDNQMIELINSCLDNQISSFDHADIYGDYTTEAAFGTAFAKSKIERDKIQHISKCGIQLLSESRRNTVKHYEYSKDYIIKSAEQSLKNLKTDYLDLLLLHRPSPLMQADEIAEAIFQLKKEDKILDFGVSNFSTTQTDLIETKTKVNYNQIQFSVSHLEAMLDGRLDHMQINRITPMAWNPLGTLFSGDNEQSKRIKKLADSLSTKYNVTVDVLLLSWILRHPAGILPVFGTTDKNRIANLRRALDVEIELQDWFALWEESQGKNVA